MSKRPADLCQGSDSDELQELSPKRFRSSGTSSGHGQGILSQSSHGEVDGLAKNAVYVNLDTDEDEDPAPASNPPWKLSSEQLGRLGSYKKIYCVLRGRRPDFYFSWEDAQKQVDGFSNCVYEAFPKGKKGSANQESVIRDAEAFMNHTPASCRYNTCKCRYQSMQQPKLPAAAVPVNPRDNRVSDNVIRDADGHAVAYFDSGPKSSNPGATTDDRSKEQSHSPDSDSKERFKSKTMCIHCQLKPLAGERLCISCLESSDIQSNVQLVTNEFGLVDEQKRVLQLVARGKNLFFTGAAGTGKSTVLKAIVSFLKKSKLNTKVVAPTGIAALGLELDATTLHTYAGWNVQSAKKPLNELRMAAHGNQVWKRFNRTDVLIIDEISMVSSDMLTRLSAIMDEAIIGAQGKPRAFGGVQLVVTGDFFQLPPVKPFESCLECGEDLEHSRQSSIHSCIKFGRSCRGSRRTCHQKAAISDAQKWAFKSSVWDDCGFTNVELQKVHRQADPDFAGILNRVRRGRTLTPQQMDALEDRKPSVNFNDAVKLFPRKYEVKAANDYHMGRLSSPVQSFKCVDDVRVPHRSTDVEFPLVENPLESRDKLLQRLKDHRYEEELELKKDMKVLLVRNLDTDAGLVNGSSGTVVGFTTGNSNLKDTLPQKHRNFAEKQIDEFENRNRKKPWPVVKFRNGVTRPIYPHIPISEIGQEEPYNLLSRTQIPLIAGWAMTIHKAQGMTLDYVVVDSNKCFEAGQTYVALSRAKKLECMQIQGGLHTQKLLSDPTVQSFMDETFGT